MQYKIRYNKIQYQQRVCTFNLPEITHRTFSFNDNNDTSLGCRHAMRH